MSDSVMMVSHLDRETNMTKTLATASRNITRWDVGLCCLNFGQPSLLRFTNENLKKTISILLAVHWSVGLLAMRKHWVDLLGATMNHKW